MIDLTQQHYYSLGVRKRHPLSRAWSNLKQRAKHRPNCEVEWKSYLDFMEWSLSNGFNQGLELCRNGDTGNYAPNNCRWDTPANNLEEAHARHYIVTHPDGKEEEVYNLNAFCKANKLNSSHMSKVVLGKAKAHKGYTACEN